MDMTWTARFAFQEDAQAVFDADRSDPNRLDEDQGPDDGIAPTPRPTVVPSRGVQGGLGGTSALGPTGRDLALGLIFVSGAAPATGALVVRRRGRRP
jgi:hypothetical protein